MALVILLVSLLPARSQRLYVNPATGQDTAAGTHGSPLRTVYEAARRINGFDSAGPAEIILTKGIHAINETVLFKKDRFTNDARLRIRSEILPDDSNWSPEQMPVVITVMPTSPDAGGEQAIGLQIEVSHVSIEGLRFTGTPHSPFMADKKVRRTYPVWRGGKDLDDLVVSQCLFTGDADVLPLHLGIIANGSGLVVDHCVFYNCKNSVVYWRVNNGNSHGNSMRFCLVYGGYFSGIWTTNQTDGDDFIFDHNILANCKAAWIRENGSTQAFKATNSIFSNNEYLSGFGSGAASVINKDSTHFLLTQNVSFDRPIVIEKDPSKRNYLQLAKGSDGNEIQAGLFKIKKFE